MWSSLGLIRQCGMSNMPLMCQKFGQVFKWLNTALSLSWLCSIVLLNNVCSAELKLNHQIINSHGEH